MTWKRTMHYWPFIGCFHSQKTSDAERRYFFMIVWMNCWLNSRTMLIWEAMTLMWHHCFGTHSSSKKLWSLQWRHNERDGVSNHQPHNCLINPLVRRKSKKASKLRVTGLCEGNSSVTGGFLAQRASNAENISIWWRYHDRNKSNFGISEYWTRWWQSIYWHTDVQGYGYLKSRTEGTGLIPPPQVQVHIIPLQWRHDGCNSVSNHQPHDCFLNSLFRCRSKKTSKLRVTGLCARNSPGTGEFPAQTASNAENLSIWWRHHDMHFLE